MALRYKVYEILDDGEETIYNPNSVDWSSFKWENGYFPHAVSKFEIYKPWLISNLYYNIVEYWDVILLLNNIKDMADVPVGSSIKIPKLEDLKRFLIKVK